jgi:hypothetical protein
MVPTNVLSARYAENSPVETHHPGQEGPGVRKRGNGSSPSDPRASQDVIGILKVPISTLISSHHPTLHGQHTAHLSTAVKEIVLDVSHDTVDTILGGSLLGTLASPGEVCFKRSSPAVGFGDGIGVIGPDYGEELVSVDRFEAIVPS